MNWDDLKYVLAVAESGSANGAARRLGVNHATVLRRIAQIEAALGTVVFDREAAGYRVTRVGQVVVEGADRVRQDVKSLQSSLAGPSAGMVGQVRVTTTDSLMVSVVGSALQTFQQAYPRISIDLMMTNHLVDLSQRQADVAIRPTRSIADGVRAERVAGLAFALYASPGYLKRDPDAPTRSSRWLVVDPSQMGSPTRYWMQTHFPEADERVRAGSFLALGALAAQGQGITILPCCLGETTPGLVRVGKPLSDIETSLWVMTTNELAGSPRIDAFCEHMLDALRQQARLLEGRA